MKFLIALMFMSVAHANSPLTCYKAALQLKDSFNSNLVQVDALNLCAGSYDVTPIDCFKAASEYRDGLGVALPTKHVVYLCSKKLIRGE